MKRAMICRSVIFTLISAVVLIPRFSVPETPRNEPDRPINAATSAEVIQNILKQLNELYVFPEVAAQMESAIRTRVRGGDYEHVTSSASLAQLLTEHLREVSHDEHLSVNYSHNSIPVNSAKTRPSPEELERMQRFAIRVNFGFEKIDRLEGNIGYIRIDGFIPVEAGAETAIAAMNFLAHTDALIFDLRESAAGGDPSMVVFLSSYLFNDEPVHLNDLYWRKGNRTQQYWTLQYVPGRRYLGKPVYILTSKRTFSAGEELAYNLQALKRATVIGEITGGGANPGEEVRISEHFAVFIPGGRAINPVTKTNWEGKGVKPDIEVPETQALKTAHLTALRKLAETSRDEKARRELMGLIETLQDRPR